MGIRLEAGKRYRSSSGAVTGPLESVEGFGPYKFRGDYQGRLAFWTKYGWAIRSPNDLIAEHVPNNPETVAGLAEIMQDAKRYRFIRDELARMNSPKMNGQHHWSFRHPRKTGNTFDEAIDKEMEQLGS